MAGKVISGQNGQTVALRVAKSVLQPSYSGKLAGGISVEMVCPTGYYCLTSFTRKIDMLAKLTSKNQLTLPKAVLFFCLGT